MKIFLSKLIEVILPLEIDQKTFTKVNTDTYKIILKLPAFSKLACIFFIFFCNFFCLGKYLVPFYFCSKEERRNLVKKNIIFKFSKGNFLKVITTYSHLVFYDNPEIQKKIGYSYNE